MGEREGSRRLRAVAATATITLPSALAAIVLLLSIVAAPASAWETVIGPPKQEVVSWRLVPGAGITGKHTVTITLLGGFCVGEPKPLAGKVSIVELPVSAANPRPTALITAHQLQLEPREMSGEVLPGEPPLSCAGLGWSTTKRIKLKRPAQGMRLLDVSWKPPLRRSPPGGLR